MQALKIGIIGAGIGGLALANALRNAGHEVHVYEQSRQFLRVGADINLTPNAVRALDGLGEGIAAAVRASAARPTHRISRTWDSGEETSRLPMDVVAFRAVVPTERVKDVPNIAAFTKWWGPTPESQIVTFPLNQGRDTFVFATTAQDSWHEESWTTEGSVDELRGFYTGFHPDARALLQACDTVMKTALYERGPMPNWSKGRVTLLGDACHPMMPFMAQGAGMAIEDAVVLSRCLAQGGDVPAALARYEGLRMERASRIQIGSRGNNWLRDGGNADWVYGYDAWQAPLQA